MQGLLHLIGLKVFSHDDLIAKYCHFECLSPPDVDGIKISDKDDQAEKL